MDPLQRFSEKLWSALRPEKREEKCMTNWDEEAAEKDGDQEFMQKAKAKVEKKRSRS